MTVKVLIYLSLIAIVSSYEYHDEHEPLTAYSSVFTSFGSHITGDDDTTENAKTNSPDVENTRTQSSPIYEIVNEQNDNGGNQQETKTPTLDNDIKPDLQSESTAPQLQPKSIKPQVLITVPANINTISTTNPPLSSAIIGKGRLLTPGLSAFASSGEESDNEPAKITIIESVTTNVTPRSIAPPSNDAKSDLLSETTDSEIQKESKVTDSKSSYAESDAERESFYGFGTSYSW